MLGRLTNTLASTNEDDEPDTDTHSWSPTDVYPPSSHTEVTGSPVTRSVTSVDVLVVSGQAIVVGTDVGIVDGEPLSTDGNADGVELGVELGIMDGGFESN
jgi:hypothetical protein